MGNAKLCPRRSRQAVCSAKDIPAKPQPTGRDAVCTISPRNRQHVWDVPGVNLHCALCDEILFTTPLELAAALLDFLLETMADSHWIAGQAEQAGQGQAGYAIAARIQSAVCVGAAMIRPLDPMPEVLYNKLQQVLLDFQVQAMHPTRSSPLKELERATLLHSKFLLELCFGSGRLSSMPTRLAVRLFSAMQVSDGLTIWSIVEELRSCMKRSWPQHKTSEGHRLQVACVVLRIYGLTSLLAGSSRILETLEKQSEYSVSSALEDMTTAAQALTMTESHQVSSFGSFGGKIDLREENDANMEVSWLVSWMVLQAAATLFCAKPCNAGQTQITAWTIKHARELATGPAASAVSLRAVSLLLSWRQKLEAVADGEETLVEVVKALSAASHYSTSQGSDYCKLMMGLIEMPSLILQLGRVRCTLHEREGLPSNCLICVPGMSDGNDKLPSSHDIVMKSADGLSPEQLPLEFLGVNGRSEEWPEDETSLMIRALKDQNRPEAVFTVHPGIILEGDDILMATMSLAAAKVRCTGLPNCIRFYSEDWPFEGDGPDGDVRAEADDPNAPVTIFINSGGGLVHSGLAILDVMANVSTPLKTVCYGRCFSIAAVLLAAGTPGHRSAYEHARLMIHEPSCSYPKLSASDVILKAEELRNTKQTLEEVLSRLTGKPLADIVDAVARDRYMSVQEGRDFGLVDSIISQSERRAGVDPGKVQQEKK